MSINQLKALTIPADQTEIRSSNTYTILGAAVGAAGAAAAAVYFAPTVIANSLFPAAISLVGLSTGYIARKMTSQTVSLSEVYEKIERMGDAHLDLEQVKEVVDISVQDKKTVVQFKDVNARVRNLSDLLDQTEATLRSKDAHKTSLAREANDKFFDFEARQLTNIPKTVDDFYNNTKNLRAAIDDEIGEYAQYTVETGSVNRRDYVQAKIMQPAYARGIAEVYLLRALLEEKDGKDFQTALDHGVEVQILSTDDPKLEEALLAAAFSEANAKDGTNKEVMITTLFRQFRDAGLIDATQLANFTQKVHALLGDDVVVIHPVSTSSSLASIVGKVILAVFVILTLPIWLPFYLIYLLYQAVFGSKPPVDPAIQLPATQAIADYATAVTTLIPEQDDLIKDYPELIQLLREKQKAILPHLRNNPLLLIVNGEEILKEFAKHDAKIKEVGAEIAAKALMIENTMLANKKAREDHFDLAKEDAKKVAIEAEENFRKRQKILDQLQQEVDRLDKFLGAMQTRLDDAKDASLPPPSALRFADNPVIPEDGIDAAAAAIL